MEIVGAVTTPLQALTVQPNGLPPCREQNKEILDNLQCNQLDSSTIPIELGGKADET
jgi:hypothetical protein